MSCVGVSNEKQFNEKGSKDERVWQFLGELEDRGH